MANEHLENLYKVLEDTTTLLSRNLNTTYLDALIETSENLLAHQVMHEDGLPDQATTDKLTELYARVKPEQLTPEIIRQALQLTLIKVIQHDQIEPNKQMTPDSMASLASYMVTVFYPKLPNPFKVGDLAVGTGNLLYAVMNQLHQASEIDVQGFGVDNDEQLLALAGVSGQWQQQTIDLFHQDALDQLVVKDLDLVVSDLPVGYYPLDDRAKNFATAAKSGHSYAHHLLIEQSMKTLKPGGLGLFFVPSEVFQSDEAKGLTDWLTKTVYFQGLLTLPESFFATKAAQKSLLVLQQPGETAQQAGKVLLGAFPEVSDRDAFGQFLTDVNQWAEQNIKK